MKQKDLILIIVVVFVSGVFSIVISNMLISSPKNRQEKVEVVEPITAEFTQPPEKYFNKSSFNPTQTIRIDGNNNNQPFNKQ